jgi:hypothetical protein
LIEDQKKAVAREIGTLLAGDCAGFIISIVEKLKRELHMATGSTDEHGTDGILDEKSLSDTLIEMLALRKMLSLEEQERINTALFSLSNDERISISLKKLINPTASTRKSCWTPFCKKPMNRGGAPVETLRRKSSVANWGQVYSGGPSTTTSDGSLNWVGGGRRRTSKRSSSKTRKARRRPSNKTRRHR